MDENWTNKQKSIHDGLSAIGKEIADFYLSALKIFNEDDPPAGSYQLMNAAREISCGLIDIFEVDAGYSFVLMLNDETELKDGKVGIKLENGVIKYKVLNFRDRTKIIEDQITQNDLEEPHDFPRKNNKNGFKTIKSPILKILSKRGHIGESTHKNRILSALGIDSESELAKKWYLVHKKLPKYTHRHGSWKEPRSMDTVRPIWTEFEEEVLYPFVGCYYSFVSRIKRISASGKYTEEGTIGTLNNILSVPKFYDYFFNNIKDIKWFPYLKKWFSPKHIRFDKNEHAYFWYTLNYLERVSEQAEQNPQHGKELLEIIDNIVKFSLNKKKIDYIHIWWYCIKILNNLPLEIIYQNLKSGQFTKWLTVFMNHSFSSFLAIKEIGEKFLPKLLQDNNDVLYKYIDTIIDALTQIKYDKEKEKIELLSDSYQIRDIFEKYAKKIGEKCSIKSLYLLANKLDNVLKYSRSNYGFDVKLERKVYQIEIERILSRPNESIYDPVRYRFKIKQYTKGQLRNNTLASHNETPAHEIVAFEIEAKNKKEAAISIQKQLKTKFSESDLTSDKFLNKFEKLFDGLYSDFSNISFKSLANEDSDYCNTEDTLISILKNTLIAKCEFNREEGQEILKDFLGNKYQFLIFRRLVLFIIDQLWKDYAAFLNQILDDVIPDVLEKFDFEVEVYDIFQNHNNKFKTDLNEKIKKLIEATPKHFHNKDNDFKNYWQFKWLSALRKNTEFASFYETIKKQVNPKDDKPYEPIRFAIQSSSIVYKSPISKEDLLKKTIPEIVKYLNEFQPAKFWDATFEGKPSKEGLADILQDFVKTNPDKFTEELEAFLNIDYFYLCRIFRGFKEAWNKGKIIDWQSIFNFGIKYFEKDQKNILKAANVAQREDSGDGIYIWIVEEFVDLIAEGARTDQRAFDIKYVDQVEKIFDLIYPLLKGEKNPNIQHDVYTYVLNTTLGRTIISYIIFSLRVAKVKQEKEKNWGNNKFERFFSIGIEGYVLFGFYLPQMLFLDHEYSKKKIQKFSLKDFSNYECQMFMAGYLTSGEINKDSYLLMRKHYEKALTNRMANEKIDKKIAEWLVQHICYGYLTYGESLQEKNPDGTDSLFWKMLNEAEKLRKSTRWMQTVDYFWSISEHIKKDQIYKERLVDFWRWTFENKEIVKTNLGNEYSAFLDNITRLTIILDEIDAEKKEWLLLSVPHINPYENGYYFIEYLKKFDNLESVKYIGQVVRKITENSILFNYPKTMQLLIDKVYAKGDKEDADDICNKYGEKGFDFLGSIWKRNNPI